MQVKKESLFAAIVWSCQLTWDQVASEGRDPSRAWGGGKNSGSFSQFFPWSPLWLGRLATLLGASFLSSRKSQCSSVIKNALKISE